MSELDDARMADAASRFVVLTGGPGSGKTTLIEALRREGFSATAEAGRGVIQDQVRIGGRGLPWQDPAAFAELMLCWEMRSHHQALELPGLVLFDRGVPDVAGYLDWQGMPVPDHLERAVRSFPYRRQVFITPPWPEIFRRDAERKQTFDEAVRTCQSMVKIYTRYGYDLIEVPCLPVEERARFVLSHLPRAGQPAKT